MKKILWSVLGVGALLVGAQVAYTAPLTDTTTQKFTVTVLKRVSITAPAAVSASLPDSNANLAFPSQAWQVKGNIQLGVGVTFVAETPFIHTTDSSYQRDAKLSVTLGSTVGPATWTIAGSGTAQTDYANVIPVTTATVSASSNKVGQAAFNVNVEFLTVDTAEVAEGDYQTTVRGTVTENL
jgi:hypothetical protein